MAHPDELSSDAGTVRALFAGHAPHRADLPIRRGASSGTDNAIYRLGDDLMLRLPRRAPAVPLFEQELNWLPHLTGLPLEVRTPQFRGRTAGDCGLPFGVFDWIKGETAELDQIVVT